MHLNQIKTLAAAACLVLGMGATAAWAEGGWTKTDKGCHVWNEDAEEGDSATWSGGCVDSYAEGNGTMVGKSGSEVMLTYSGMMKRGKFQGQGTATLSGEGTFVGEWRDGEPWAGTLTATDGKTYPYANGECPTCPDD